MRSRAGPDSAVRGLGRDGLVLGSGAALSALTGLVGWLIVARLVPQSEFGAASAFASGFLLVSGLTELNLGVALLRWAPAAGNRAAAVVRAALLAVVALSSVAAVAYLLFPGTAVIVAAVGPVPVAVAVLLFVATTAAWSVLHLQDFAFVGLGRPGWSVGKNVLLAVLRITALVTVGTLGVPGAIVWALAGSTVVCAVATAALSALLTRFAPPGVGPGRRPTRSEIIGFLGPTYAGTIAVTVLYNQIPLAVTARLGTATGGAFFVAWQAVTVLDVIATYVASSVVGAVARDPGRAPELAAAARRRLLVLFLPVLVVGVLVAEPGLRVFGPGFAEAAPALQVLLGGLALRLVVVHVLALQQALGDARGFAALSILTTVLVLLVAVLVPADLVAVALGYAGAQVVSVAALPLAVRRLRRAATGSHPTPEPSPHLEER